MSLLLKTKKICQTYNIYLQKSKGQNFLINEDIYNDIIDIASIENKEVLEVGPGLGFLTEKLTKLAKAVVAVELDNKLVNYLNTLKILNNLNNLEIINQDILKFNPNNYFSKKENYYLVANLPYNITSIFLRTFLSHIFPPKSLTLMLQKEVAERIIAKAPNMNLLAISVQYYAQVEIKKIVKADNFWPIPKVDSAIVKINSIKNNLSDTKQFFRLVKIGFSAKRKMLKNNLAAGLKINEEKIKESLVKIGLKEDVRAQNLEISDWQKLLLSLEQYL